MTNETRRALPPQVVIVGAGFAGLQAAIHLENAHVRLTVIDRNNHHLFQPLLYQVATAGLSPTDITAPIRHVLRHQANTEVLMGDVVDVTPETGQITVRGEGGMIDTLISYDYLVLATGSQQTYFGHDEWAPYALKLKTVEDATVIRRKVLLAFETAEMEMPIDPERAKTHLTFVVVGGGPTGVEMAGAIAELSRRALVADFRHINPASAHVILVEAAPRLLATFPEKLARRATRKLQAMGVDVRVGVTVDNITPNTVTIAGQIIPTHTVIWAAGVRGSDAGVWLKTPTDRAGRVIVNPDLSVPGHPDIFVLGDTASVKWGDKQVPGVAPAAMQMGQYVARVIAARAEKQPEPAPFTYVNKGNLATVGRTFAIADLHFFRLSGYSAWLAWMSVHIFYLIGFRSRLLVMFQWAWAYLTFQRGARLITWPEQPDTPPTPPRP